ncbi:hypothetical protein P9112_006660 [Eukaryota sp. TZLM1-RC]
MTFQRRSHTRGKNHGKLFLSLILLTLLSFLIVFTHTLATMTSKLVQHSPDNFDSPPLPSLNVSLSTTLKDPFHPFNNFKYFHKHIKPIWYMLSNHSSPDSVLSYQRWGVSINVIPFTYELKVLPYTLAIVVSDQITLVRPNFHLLIQSTINQITSSGQTAHTFFHSFTPNAWLLLVPTLSSPHSLSFPSVISSSSHHPFTQCSWLTWREDDGARFGYGGPFSIVKFSGSFLYQSQIDNDNSFPPLKVLADSQITQSSHHQFPIDKTAYVFSWIGPFSLSNTLSTTLSSMVASVNKVRLYSRRRIVILVEDCAFNDFVELFDLFPLGVEIVKFKHSIDMADLPIFQNKVHYRASFYLKCFYIVNINDYVSPPIERVITLDWDVFLLTSIDHIFDLPLEKFSLVATGESSATYVTINGGLLSFSPGDTNFLNFWKEIISNFQHTPWNYYYPHNQVLSGSEQSIFLYYYRSINSFYYLPNTYNMLSKGFYHSTVLNEEDAKVIHFAGDKPWLNSKKGHKRVIVNKYLPELKEFTVEIIRKRWFSTASKISGILTFLAFVSFLTKLFKS